MLTTQIDRHTTGARRMDRKDELKLHIGDFARFSAAMMVLGEMAPERMTLAQVLFFVITASADMAGKDPTFSEIRDTLGDEINRSLHTTYRVLLEPSRAYPNGLGWLRQEPDPVDTRQKFLRVTPKGRRVLAEVLKAMRND